MSDQKAKAFDFDAAARWLNGLRLYLDTGGGTTAMLLYMQHAMTRPGTQPNIGDWRAVLSQAIRDAEYPDPLLVLFMWWAPLPVGDGVELVTEPVVETAKRYIARLHTEAELATLQDFESKGGYDA